jgi:NodT family efflux transporter outer membrane factor (OMF) lipoprotein
VSKADVVQAESQLRSTQAQEIDTRVTRATLENAIAVLIGKPPAALRITPVPFAVAMPGIPPGIPSTLLERRPDIAAAERRVAAANARIGVAQAAYFPTLALDGRLGFTSNSFSHLFSLPNRTWSLGAALAGTLIDFGARSGQVTAAEASYDEAVANYRQAVLTGFQEVENNLATLHWLAEESSVQLEAMRAARESVTLTSNQYKAGTVSFLNVVIVQAAQLSEERTMVNIIGRRLAATVALIRAIGGDWEHP